MSSPLKRKFDDNDDQSEALSERTRDRNITPSDVKGQRQAPGPSVTVKAFSQTPEPPSILSVPSIQIQPRLPKLELKNRLQGAYNNGYRLLFNDEIRDALRPSDTIDPARSNLQESQVGGTIWTPADKERFFGAIARYGRDLSRVATAVGKTVLEVSLYVHLLDQGAQKQRILGFDADPKRISAAAHITPKCRRALEYAADGLAWHQFKEEILLEVKRHGEHWLITYDSDDENNQQEEEQIDDEPATEDDEDIEDKRSEKGQQDEDRRLVKERTGSLDDDFSMTGDLDRDILRLAGVGQQDSPGTPQFEQPSSEVASCALGGDAESSQHVRARVRASLSEKEADIATSQMSTNPPPLNAIDPNLPDFSSLTPGLIAADEPQTVDSPLAISAMEVDVDISEARRADEEESDQGNDHSDSEDEPASDAVDSVSGIDQKSEPDGRDSDSSLLDHSAMLILSKHIFMNSSKPDMQWSNHLTTYWIPTEHLPQQRPLTSPALFRTAYEDLTRVVTTLTKRLVATAQYQAQSRMRMMDNTHEPPAKYVTVEKRDVHAAVDILGMKRDTFEYWAGLPRRHDVHWEYAQPDESGQSKDVRISPQTAETCLRERGAIKKSFSRIVVRAYGEIRDENEKSETGEEEGEERGGEERGGDETEAEDAELEQVDQENNEREEQRMFDMVGEFHGDYWKTQAKVAGAWCLHKGLYNSTYIELDR